MVSAAHAGVAISLDPSADGPYTRGQTIQVDVYALLTPGTPSVQPTGTQNQIRVRFFNLDLTDSSPSLGITPVMNHLDADPDEDGVPNPVPFWFMSNTNCTNNPTSCGTNYFIDGDLETITPDILNITWTGLTSSASGMITLNQTAPKLVGSLSVTFNEVGTQTLDVLNDDEVSLNFGAEIRHGFGVAADPTDPLSPIRANGGAMFMVAGQENGFVANVVPEPATLVLLGLGGVAAAFRRRRSA